MIYEDDKILSLEEYEDLAKKYYQSLKDRDVKFVDLRENEELIKETMSSFSLVNQCLFRLGGFLNTSKLYFLTNKQIKIFKTLYDVTSDIVNLNFKDKTKTFLQYIGLESQLILNLIDLAKKDKNQEVLDRIINDRLVLLKNIFI